MVAASCLLTEGQLTCCICLDVFTDPVSTPCGHNFCKACITEHWSIDVPCQCPMCKKYFYPKPELQVNTLISEMADEFRQAAQWKANDNRIPEQQDDKAEVPTDFCTGTTKKALIFLLGVMFVCTVLSNMMLNVPPKEKSEATQDEPVRVADKMQRMIQECRLKIDEMKRSVELGKKEADREISEGVQVFSTLKECLERGQAMLIQTIRDRQRKTEEQAERFIAELEQKISELRGRKAEVELVSTARLEEPKEEVKKEKAELKRVRRFVVNVTLDPDTAQRSLILSDDLKQVRNGNAVKSVLYNPGRFDSCVAVLGKQGFSSGRFYYEVKVKGKTAWDLGVASESITRKGLITLHPQKGYWTLSLRNGNEYKALSDCPYVMWKPEKVGVFVDYEGGVVSFYNADTGARICSYTGCSFSERLYPFFSPGLAYGVKAKWWYGDNSAPLVITPVRHTE